MDRLATISPTAARRPRAAPRRPEWLLLVATWLFALGSGIAQDTNAWSALQSRGVLRWGNDAEGGAPYIYHPPGQPDVLTGFEVDLANELCRRLKLRGEFVQGNWDMLIPTLKQGGAIDLILAGLERSPENLAKVAMGRPYYFFAQQLVVRVGTPPVAALTGMKGKRIGVLSGTTSQHLVEAAPGVEMKVYQDNVNYFRDLEVGRLDAVLTDGPIAQTYLAGNTKLIPGGPPFARGAYAIAVRHQDVSLLDVLDPVLLELLHDGTLKTIYSRYGLWNEDQSALGEWKEEGRVGEQHRSALREWTTYLPLLLRAAVTTVWVTCGGMILAVTWGLVLALCRLDGPAPLRWAATAYIEVFRGTPLLLQIYFLYFGLAQQLGVRLPAGVAAVLSLGLNYAANEAENYRAGLLAVPRGQAEAAAALGMSRSLALRRVLLPQALRISLPSITNDFIAMFKDSSIVSVIALVELTKQYQIRAIDTGDYVGLGLMTAGIYFVMSYSASLGARHLERRLRHDSR